jgi:hypothetical protein
VYGEARLSVNDGRPGVMSQFEHAGRAARLNE